METEALVGQSLECACGKTHRIEPREVLYARGAIERMPDLCARHAAGRNVAVVFDERTGAVAGRELAAALARAGWEVVEVLVADGPGGQSPVTDPPTQADVAARIGGAHLVVSAGSGVISDLGKWTAFEAGVPAVTFGTAASMNGYAAANVAGKVEGVKVVVRARPPAAVAADPDILAAAPPEMTASGLGDVLAKSVSSTDWRLNHLLFGDYYCPRSVGLIAEIEPLYLENPEGLAAGDRPALEALFDALLLTGIAMTMAETSDPASGGEHLISHTLDMKAALDGGPHDLHGRQVGVGTLLASEVYRRVLAIESPELTVPAGDVDRAYWGPLTEEVRGKFAEKRPRMERAASDLSEGARWDALREDLAARVRSPDAIADCLRRAKAAWRAEDLGISRSRLLGALAHAHEMRGRFTILDLGRLTGVLPAALEEIVEQYG